MADTYSFTTKFDDNYFYRVQDETPDSVNFLLITDSSTVEDAVTLVLFIKKETLNQLIEEFPNERLLGRSLGELALDREQLGEFDSSPDGRFYVVSRFGLNRATGEREALAVKNEIKRLQNVIDGRVIRVTVESF